jgi:release factor glutamine methyltransferase
VDGEFGSASFSGLRLLTAPGRVMTPRRATERLVERALGHVGGKRARIADVGTGSGAVAVAIALRAPQAEIWAVDVSRAAIELARTNVARYGSASTCTSFTGDSLSPFRERSIS